MTVVAVVPVKDHLTYTEGIYRQLAAAGVEALILDNGSTDPATVDYLAEIGATDAAGETIHQMWNRGIEWALTRPTVTAVAILNNDLELGPGALQRCAEWLSSDPTLVATCPNYDDRSIAGVQLCRSTCGGRYDGSGGFAGFCMVVAADWFRSGYRFPTSMRWWHGDDDLLLSAMSAGRRCGIVGDVWVKHLDGGGRTGNWRAKEWAPILAADRAAFRARWPL